MSNLIVIINIALLLCIKLAICQNPCNLNPCQNNGVCFAENTVIVRCECQSGYTGTFCENPVGCTCLNGGTCVYSYFSLSYTCRCPPDRSGPNCELVNPCYFNPCKNGATCSVAANNDPICTCLPDFTGSFCNIKFGINGCINNNVCQNGGTCYSELSFFGTVTEFCKCPANIFGQYCEIRITNQLCNEPDSSYILCPVWLMMGFCDFRFKYGYVPVPISCPSSCSLCKSFPSCQDSQTNCILWSTMGLCSRISQIDANLCRKSCGLCPLNIP